MEEIFTEAQRLRLFRPLDVQFARILATPNEPAIMLASACLSADAGAGHVCLPLELLTPARLFDSQLPALAKQAWMRAGSPSLDDWQHHLLASKAVSDGSRPTPLVLDNQRLYLQRMWRHECTVAQFFNRPRSPLAGDETTLAAVLARYFPGDVDGSQIDWQKIAAAVAITHSVALISGGPGTGKTFTVAKLLAALLQLNDGVRMRILMAAPTGKAAARLSESIGSLLQRLGLDKEHKQRLPREAITLHRLLGAQPNSQRMRYHRGNPLHVDILIIDEASMIDLPMMANVIAALPPQARVIFIGDRFQLSSVEAGAVLGDICQFAEAGYSSSRRAELMRLTGFTLPASTGAGYGIADSLCLLRKSYRFDEGSGIGRLANAINVGNDKDALALLNAGAAADVVYTPLHNTADYQRMLDDCVEGYRDYLSRVRNHDMPSAILDAFNRFRLLCALREGPFGVTGLNDRIELALSKAGLLTLGNAGRSYTGRPVMIIRNAPLLGLYNGDIGILLLDGKQTMLRVYFSLPDGGVKAAPLSRLPEHETAFAITVHKSQGSEFHHTALTLPNQILPALTRELLYTAVTRARARLSLYATNEVFRHAMATKTQRRSGLIERLVTGQAKNAVHASD